MKKCNLCNEEKSFDFYYKNNLSKDGYFKSCKECSKKRSFNNSRKKILEKNEELNFLKGEFYCEHFETGLLVSNLGRVFSKEKESGKNIFSHYLKQTYMNNGYMTVSYNNKHLYVHKLVAESFFLTGDHKEYVNHIDGNKLNNKLKNLEFCTHLENINHAKLIDKYSKKLNRNQVLKIRQLSIRRSVKELSKRYMVSETNIRLILKRKIWNHV